MDRGKRVFYNSIANLALQVTTMICGFILPRLILGRFGSSYNGITASVSQFLSVVAILRSGVGGATRVALYKALANNDYEQVSATVKATELFMRKVALIFLGIVLVFSILYPYFVRNEFDVFFSASLVLIISLSTFIQYAFGITYQILFQADQRQYITSVLGIFTIVLNTIIAAILIRIGVGIHGVKLGSAVAYSISPVVHNILAKKQYHLNPRIEPDFSSINQRWDAFYHQLAAFIHNNTDITLLTVFMNTKEISVYTVYYLVANGLKNVMNTLTIGIEAAFGNILARNEIKTLKLNVCNVESMLHVVSSVLFGSAIVLITPFVQVYTRGIDDVNYTRFLFGYLAIVEVLLYVLRSPYEAIINAAGHFRQTKKYAFMEAGINILVSIVMIQQYGIVGVVLGTVVAIAFRNTVYGIYSSRVIIHRSMLVLLKRFAVTVATLIAIFIVSSRIYKPDMLSYVNWILYASEVTVLSITITVLFNVIFFRNELKQMLSKLLGIIGRVIWKN